MALQQAVYNVQERNRLEGHSGWVSTAVRLLLVVVDGQNLKCHLQGA